MAYSRPLLALAVKRKRSKKYLKAFQIEPKVIVCSRITEYVQSTPIGAGLGAPSTQAEEEYFRKRRQLIGDALDHFNEEMEHSKLSGEQLREALAEEARRREEELQLAKLTFGLEGSQSPAQHDHSRSSSSERSHSESSSESLGGFFPGYTPKQHPDFERYREYGLQNKFLANLPYDSRRNLFRLIHEIWKSKKLNEVYYKFLCEMPENEQWEGDDFVAAQFDSRVRYAFHIMFMFAKESGRDRIRSESPAASDVGGTEGATNKRARNSSSPLLRPRRIRSRSKTDYRWSKAGAGGLRLH